ncbi:MAG: protein translocase subunit SecD [Actinobacteria bacterium]|nr:protein translocase subunit SecD [Actinomycetota bacterium]
MNRNLFWRSFFVLLALGGAISLVLTRPVKLGLDLEGGTQIVLEAQDTELERVDSDTLSRTLEVLRRRVDQLGVSEPTLQESGSDRVIIELPGVSDPDAALEVIGKTAQLTFHPVLGIAEPEAEPTDDGGDGNGDGDGKGNGNGNGNNDQKEDEPAEDELILPDSTGTDLRLAPASLTGDVVDDAEAVADTQGLGWTVSISFRGTGGADWETLTGDAACSPVGDPQRRVAIVLDEEIITSPEVDESVQCDVGIPGGSTVITGNFTSDEAKDLALLIRAGALPVPVEVVERRTIGPTLGDAAIDASILAALIGGALTILYVIFYYRLLGVLAALALLAYGLLSYAVLLGLNATLTLPGIAGFVLAIGMAVDANVLVFERSKEEFATGKRLRTSILDGFKKAWSAIADSNATTVIAAIILFYFATGAVRGFGVTLTVGVGVSLFSALVITRLFAELAMKNRRLSKRPAWFGMNVGGKLRRRLEERPINIMGHTKIWFIVSGAVLVFSVGGLVTKGLDFGLEFTGGRLLEFSTAEPADLNEVRTEMADIGYPRALVQASGDGNVAIRVSQVSDEDEAAIEAAVNSVAGDTEVVRDEFVGPTIGNELKRKALIALSLGLAAQMLYLAIRFRWTFGASALVALFHDVMILLGVFAWLDKDIDGVFIAALLTVIGYSVNDSVVVFDRIRERLRTRGKRSLESIANEACLQTIPRTINTGLGAFFILIALYFLGGETLTDFAFALIIGIAIGTYSSVFTAAPAMVNFEYLSGSEHHRPDPSTREPLVPAAKKVEASAAAVDETAEAPAPTTTTTATTTTKRPAPKKRAGSAKRKRRRR